jgi:hypothetical protein
VAARAGVVLLFLAAVFLTWSALRAEVPAAVVAILMPGGGLMVAGFARGLSRAHGLPSRSLEARPDGTIWLRQAGQGPVAVTVGPSTRLLGPTVFIDLRVADAESARPLRYWISPLDVPRDVLRRWSVVLPRCGRVACA